MRVSLIRRAKKGVSDTLAKSSHKEVLNEPSNVSLYEKYAPFSTPVNVKGIWRAPRFQTFTKEQFDKAYPESYKKMRIGLGRPGTFAGDHADPRFDEVSPLVWTFIVMSPLVGWYLYEKSFEWFPRKEGH